MVRALYCLYAKGLVVYGVMTEEKDLAPARMLVEKHGFSFPMLVGNEQLKKDYKVNAIPLYILVDRQGKIAFVSEGYSGELEEAIKKVL